MNTNHNLKLAHHQSVYAGNVAGNYSKTELAAHREFAHLLQSLHRICSRSDTDAISAAERHTIRRAVLALSSMLADARTLIAGERPAGISNGCLSSMEYELIAMDYRDDDSRATRLFKELDDIHRRAELLNETLLQH